MEKTIGEKFGFLRSRYDTEKFLRKQGVAGRRGLANQQPFFDSPRSPSLPSKVSLPIQLPEGQLNTFFFVLFWRLPNELELDHNKLSWTSQGGSSTMNSLWSTSNPDSNLAANSQTHTVGCVGVLLAGSIFPGPGPPGDALGGRPESTRRSRCGTCPGRAAAPLPGSGRGSSVVPMSL